MKQDEPAGSPWTWTAGTATSTSSTGAGRSRRPNEGSTGFRGREEDMGRHTRQVGDLELVVRCDDAFARQAESLLDVVARFRGEGKGLADGVTVQFGFSLLTLRQHG